MTRDELYSVKDLKKELGLWERRLKHLREKSLVSSKAPDGMPFQNTGVVSDKTFEYTSDILQMEEDIETFKLAIEVKINEIEHYIMTLDDSLLRQIIEYHCCQCKTWSQTAALIGSGTTEDSIKKYFNRKFPSKNSVPKVP